ncbi:cobyrinate a,c-diamide synthase [Clostridium sp. MCC353]|nr:cobyrinate a,c-diamide synthase [Clostridium sp. MCC353]MBT9779976.1 cobyrinate a,c-diamide synthase [Clostridium sp. MCC353]
MLAAVSSGSGKTTITCGLLQAMINRRIKCVSFKCGPDYIDPMFHKYVLGVPGANLDSYFLTKEQIRDHFTDTAADADLSVIEGVMGYYDGLAGTSVSASSYDIAGITDTPVILIVNGKGASLSLIPVIKGFLEYVPDSRIKGVILNRTTKEMAARLTPLIEKLGVSVIGYIRNNEEMNLDSRHLGLVMPQEYEDLRDRIDRIAKELEETLDLDMLLKTASEAPPLPKDNTSGKRAAMAEVKIGVARDEAFCFYYQENLKLLQELGAELIEFSPLRDHALPNGLDAVLLGGGYPELYAKQLSENQGMLESMRASVENGIFLLAECGGFLYLHDTLEGSDGACYPMLGIIHGDAYRTKRLSRFGYIELSDNTGRIKAHEFHYWDSTSPGDGMTAVKPLNGRTWHCIHKGEHMIAGFPHLYYSSNREMVKKWIDQLRKGTS